MMVVLLAVNVGIAYLGVLAAKGYVEALRIKAGEFRDVHVEAHMGAAFFGFTNVLVDSVDMAFGMSVGRFWGDGTPEGIIYVELFDGADRSVQCIDLEDFLGRMKAVNAVL